MANQNSKNKKNNNKKKVATNNVSNKKEKELKKVESVETKEVEVKEVKVQPKEVKENVSSSVEEKSFKLTSRQKDIILVLLVVVLLIVAMIVTAVKNPKLDIELPVSLSGEAGYTSLAYSEYEEKINNEETFLVVIVKDGCGYCEAYIPILKEVAEEYQIPINYINLTDLTSEEQQKLVQSNSYLKTREWGTPTTLLLYGNKVINSIGGYVEKDTLVNFVKENIKVSTNE